MSFTARDIAFSGLSYIVHIGRAEYAFQKVTYADKLDGVELLTNIGFQQLSARTRGVYKVDPSSVTMLRGEWDRMMKKFPSNGFGNFLFPVTITGRDPELPQSVDRLLNCSILSNKQDIEATGKATIVEFTMQPQQIVWNGKTINLRRNAPQRPPQGGSAPTGESIGAMLNISISI